MTNVTMRQMLEAGVHYGHQTRFVNPKMFPYLYGQRNKLHIFNLEKTLPLLHDSLQFLKRIAQNRGTILFVGTKRQAREIIATHATRCDMPYVDNRWLGGTLTNFKTLRTSLKKLKEMRERIESDDLKQLSKKEALMFQRECDKLKRSMGGIASLTSQPDALFVIDVGYHKNAVIEARKLNIPVVAVVDSNHSPDDVDYIIPGNDDSSRATDLYASLVADAVLEGRSSAVDDVVNTIRQGSEADDDFVEEQEEFLDESGEAA